MSENRFKAVVLDLFDTLVNWSPGMLPRMQWHGREMHSTIPWIMPSLEEALGSAFDPDLFVGTYMSVVEEINAVRDRENIEITCLERFVRVLIRMGFKDDKRTRSLAETLTRTHMNGVRNVTSAPANRAEAVRRLSRHYRLGLLSNFDDSTTGHQILSDTSVGSLFEAVIISADVGLRKPNPAIFERIMTMLDLRADDILFVGDTPLADVAGPKRVGMVAAWINRKGEPMPEGLPVPDIELSDLAELPDLLGC